MITGFYTYRDTTILQHRDVSIYFKKLFENLNPSQILEIGTSHGGLTILLRDLLDQIGLVNTDFRTYDVCVEANRYSLLKDIKGGSKIDFRLKNMFNHMYDDLVEPDEMREFIQRPGVTIVLCDGGSKKNEFKILSKFLKSGDIIMAHDYASSPEYFESHINNKIWNWHEIKDSDIEECVNKYNLEPYMQEEFQKVVWVCKIKK